MNKYFPRFLAFAILTIIVSSCDHTIEPTGFLDVTNNSSNNLTIYVDNYGYTLGTGGNLFIGIGDAGSHTATAYIAPSNTVLFDTLDFSIALRDVVTWTLVDSPGLKPNLNNPDNDSFNSSDEETEEQDSDVSQDYAPPSIDEDLF